MDQLRAQLERRLKAADTTLSMFGERAHPNLTELRDKLAAWLQCIDEQETAQAEPLYLAHDLDTEPLVIGLELPSADDDHPPPRPTLVHVLASAPRAPSSSLPQR